MYRVEIKKSAIDTVPELETEIEENDHILDFISEKEAKKFKDDYSSAKNPLRLQSLAPQELKNIDKYLVKDGQVNEWKPIDTERPGETFPVGGNIYGIIGMGILAGGQYISPPLKHYFSNEGAANSNCSVNNVDPEPVLPDPISEMVSWNPDLRIDVTSEGTKSIMYFAEVKSGDASFERSQRKDMQKVAESHNVLRIRIDISDLPQTYTTRIAEVEPDRWPD